ncbi:hypothetical protein D6783_00815, partial [Candidatus Woesearchaeota archaeon]
KDTFQRLVGNTTGLEITNAHNPSHLAGLGDFIKALIQSRRSTPVRDVDLENMLHDIHTKVHTQKIILVGHSQGSFYTNALYEYLTNNGIPESAIAVVNVATPASSVAGGGAYVTSATDKVINAVRTGITLAGGNPPLPANTTFTLTPAEEANPFGGHSFSEVYLEQGDFLIISHIRNAIDRLTTAPVPDTVASGCFNPPGVTLATKAKQLALDTGDATLTIGTLPLRIARTVSDTILTVVDTYVVHPIASFLKPHTPQTGEESPAPPPVVPPTPPPTPPTEPTPDLSHLQAQLNQATALVALLQLQIQQVQQEREAATSCTTTSIKGPWDLFWWQGDTGGCDDPTPGVTKMFHAPISGAGGESVCTVNCIIGPPPGAPPDGGPL